MISNIEKIQDGYERIDTYAIDDIGDNMIFYRKGDFLTDDEYYRYQCECAGWSDEKIGKVMFAMASWFGCHFNGEKLTIECKNHDEGLERMTQCATAICSLISTERLGLVKVAEND